MGAVVRFQRDSKRVEEIRSVCNLPNNWTNTCLALFSYSQTFPGRFLVVYKETVYSVDRTEGYVEMIAYVQPACLLIWGQLRIRILHQIQRELIDSEMLNFDCVPECAKIP